LVYSHKATYSEKLTKIINPPNTFLYDYKSDKKFQESLRVPPGSKISTVLYKYGFIIYLTK